MRLDLAERGCQPPPCFNCEWKRLKSKVVVTRHTVIIFIIIILNLVSTMMSDDEDDVVRQYPKALSKPTTETDESRIPGTCQTANPKYLIFVVATYYGIRGKTTLAYLVVNHHCTPCSEPNLVG
jgi:hypothetical protein